MGNIADKLRFIMEGGLLLEAPEDKYDLDNNGAGNTGTDPAPDNQDGATTTPGDDAGTTDNATADDTTGDDAAGNYDLDDDGDNNPDGGGGDPATSDNINTDGDSGDGTDPAQPAVGEILNINPKTRAILAFKNFEAYRDLRDDTARLITELSEFIPINEEVRSIVNISIEKGTDLVNKLNDYILYKYTDTSYELNYYNFMQFILEKRYLNELYDNIIKSSSQVKSNK